MQNYHMCVSPTLVYRMYDKRMENVEKKNVLNTWSHIFKTWSFFHSLFFVSLHFSRRSMSIDKTCVLNPDKIFQPADFKIKSFFLLVRLNRTEKRVAFQLLSCSNKADEQMNGPIFYSLSFNSFTEFNIHYNFFFHLLSVLYPACILVRKWLVAMIIDSCFRNCLSFRHLFRLVLCSDLIVSFIVHKRSFFLFLCLPRFSFSFQYRVARTLSTRRWSSFLFFFFHHHIKFLSTSFMSFSQFFGRDWIYSLFYTFFFLLLFVSRIHILFAHAHPYPVPCIQNARNEIKDENKKWTRVNWPHFYFLTSALNLIKYFY